MQNNYKLAKLLKEKLCEENGTGCCYVGRNGESCPAIEQEGYCCLDWIIEELKKKNDITIKQQQIENKKLELMSVLTNYLNEKLEH